MFCVVTMQLGCVGHSVYFTKNIEDLYLWRILPRNVTVIVQDDHIQALILHKILCSVSRNIAAVTDEHPSRKADRCTRRNNYVNSIHESWYEETDG